MGMYSMQLEKSFVDGAQVKEAWTSILQHSDGPVLMARTNLFYNQLLFLFIDLISKNTDRRP